MSPLKKRVSLYTSKARRCKPWYGGKSYYSDSEGSSAARCSILLSCGSPRRSSSAAWSANIPTGNIEAGGDHEKDYRPTPERGGIRQDMPDARGRTQQRVAARKRNNRRSSQRPRRSRGRGGAPRWILHILRGLHQRGDGAASQA